MKNLEEQYRRVDPGDGTGTPWEARLIMHEWNINLFGKSLEERKNIKYDEEKWAKVWEDHALKRRQHQNQKE